MVEFCGWEMPLFYSGIIQEHQQVRKGVGIFDISHMGRLVIKGKDAERFLDYLSTNRIAGKKDGSATYTVWTLPQGGCVDDVIVFKINPQEFFVIANAGNREKDLQHLLKHSQNFDVQIHDRYHEDGILAIQGPKAQGLVSSLFPEADQLKAMCFAPIDFQGNLIWLSHTGYTGAGGFEIFAPSSAIDQLWDLFLTHGKDAGIVPVGLGARDTLRLEMGYALYGHEISEDIAPTESIAAWSVKLNKDDFLGKASLIDLQTSPAKRSEYGIVMLDKGIARHDYPVLKDGKLIGRITSGTLSPSLNKAIAIALVQGPLKEGEIVEVQIRNNLCRAQVATLPFLQTPHN